MKPMVKHYKSLKCYEQYCLQFFLLNSKISMMIRVSEKKTSFAAKSLFYIRAVGK